MATYDVIEGKDRSSLGPITIPENGFNTSEPWEGHTNKEIEDYLCRVIEKLGETSDYKMTVRVLNDNGDAISALNFVDGTNDIRLRYSIKYASSDDVRYQVYIRMSVNGQYITDDTGKVWDGSGTALPYADEQIRTTPNIASYLKLTNNEVNEFFLYVFDKTTDEATGLEIESPRGQARVSLTRVVSQISFRAQSASFGRVDPTTIDFNTTYNYNENSPYTYIKLKCEYYGSGSSSTGISTQYYKNAKLGGVVSTDYLLIPLNDPTDNPPTNKAVNTASVDVSSIVGTNPVQGIYKFTACLVTSASGFDAESYSDENASGVVSNEIASTFIYTTAATTNGTTFVLADNTIGTQSNPVNKNDYVAIKYKVYTKGADNATTPLILLAEEGNTLVNKAIKVVENNVEYTWNYFVSNSTGNSFRLQFALPQQNTNGEYIYVNGILQPDARQYQYKDVRLYTTSANTIEWEDMISVLNRDQQTQGKTKFHFEVKNKANSDWDAADVSSNGYKLKFYDVKWNEKGSGYTTITIDGVTSNVLKLSGKSTATVIKANSGENFYPLYVANTYNSNVSGYEPGGIIGNGRTIKVTFAVSNVSDATSRIIQCFDGSTGFYVTGNSIYVNFNNTELTSSPDENPDSKTSGIKNIAYNENHNDRRFAEMKRIELCITVSNKEIRYYINGELAGFRAWDLQSTTIINQSEGIPLIFGGEGATLYLYDVKYAEYPLTPLQVLQDYAMSQDNSSALTEFYTKQYGPYYYKGFQDANRIGFYSTKDDGTYQGAAQMTLANAVAYGRWLASQGITDFAVFVTTNACNSEKYIGDTKEHATAAESIWIFRFKQDEQGRGIVDPEHTLYIEGHNDDAAQTWELKAGAGALRIRRQGTSTSTGTIGNIRWDTRGACILRHWNPATEQFYDGEVDGVNVEKIGKKAEIFYIPDGNAIPCFLITAKKNVNESTHTRNVPVAKWFEAVSRQVASENTNYEDVLTPPQIAELRTIEKVYPDDSRRDNIKRIKTRQVIDGIPALGFEIGYDREPSYYAVKDGNRYVAVPDPISTFSAINPATNTPYAEFIGQFDLTTDKKNMKIFGFGGHTEWIKDENGEVTTTWVKDTPLNKKVTYPGSIVIKERKDTLGPDGKTVISTQVTWDDDYTEYNCSSDDFSIEYKDHNDLQAFRTRDLSSAGKVDGAPQDLEYRYPESFKYNDKNGVEQEIEDMIRAGVTPGLESYGPLQNLYDFLWNCAPYEIRGANTWMYQNGMAVSTQYLPSIESGNNAIEDGVDARNNLFRNELKYYVDVNQFLTYYIGVINYPLGVDQEGKNLFLSSYGHKDLKNYTQQEGSETIPIKVQGDMMTVNGNLRRILRILAYDFDTNLRLDNRNNFKWGYTERYEDGNFDESIRFDDEYGSLLWYLINKNFSAEIHQIESILYSSLLKAEDTDPTSGVRNNGMLYYLFDKHINSYNSIQYNLNSEYCYTKNAADYSKTHGSAKEDIEWFVKGRMKFLPGVNFSGSDDDRNSDYIKNSEVQLSVTAPGNIDVENYTYLFGHTPEEAVNYNTGMLNDTNMFNLDITCYERNTVSMRYGSGNFQWAWRYCDVVPVVEYIDRKALITGYQRLQRVSNNWLPYSLKPTNYLSFTGDFNIWLYGTDQIKTIAGLDKFYISKITKWGGLVNIEELILGNTASFYANTKLEDLNIGTNIFGSCKKLNLAGLSALRSIDLQSFPILEEFEGIRTTVTTVTLPVGNSLKTLSLPDTIDQLIIDNKPNLETIKFNGYKVSENSQGISQIKEINVTDSSKVAADTAIAMLNILL